MLQAIPIHDRLVLFFFFALVILGVLTPMPTFQRHIMFNAHVFCWLAAPTVRRSVPSVAHTIALTCPRISPITASIRSSNSMNFLVPSRVLVGRLQTSFKTSCAISAFLANRIRPYSIGNSLAASRLTSNGECPVSLAT